MGVCNYVIRRGATYSWRRRVPGGSGAVQVSLGTSCPWTARRLGGIVTGESHGVFDRMATHGLTAAQAKAWLDHVVRRELAKIEGLHAVAANDPAPGRTRDHRRDDVVHGHALRILAEDGLGARAEDHGADIEDAGLSEWERAAPRREAGGHREAAEGDVGVVGDSRPRIPVFPEGTASGRDGVLFLEMIHVETPISCTISKSGQSSAERNRRPGQRATGADVSPGNSSEGASSRDVWCRVPVPGPDGSGPGSTRRKRARGRAGPSFLEIILVESSAFMSIFQGRRVPGPGQTRRPGSSWTDPVVHGSILTFFRKILPKRPNSGDLTAWDLVFPGRCGSWSRGPLVDAFFAWLEAQAARVSRKSDLGVAMAYMLKRRTASGCFLTMAASTSTPTMNRRHALFAGHDEGGRKWAQPCQPDWHLPDERRRTLRLPARSVYPPR